MRTIESRITRMEMNYRPGMNLPRKEWERRVLNAIACIDPEDPRLKRVDDFLMAVLARHDASEKSPS